MLKVFLTLLIAVTFCFEPVVAQPSPEPTGTTVSEASPGTTVKKNGLDESSSDQELSPEERAKRKTYLTLVWMMWGGVVSLAVLLFLIVFIFGSRARRVARKASPDAPPRDPMWYLKQKTEQGSEFQVDSSETEKK